MAKIKRSGKGVRRAAKSQSRAAGARRAKAKTTGVFDSAIALLPFTEDQLHRIFLAIILGGAVALAFFIASLAGVPAMAKAEVARLASDAGFEVRHVRVSGTDRMDEEEVYKRVLAQRDRPMPQVEIDALREELLELPWVKDARVSIQLPETLAIDIVEREPHAVLEDQGKLKLVGPEGTVLDEITADAVNDMLLISGPGSTRQIASLDKLLASAPALGPQVKSAEWVGNRRWNLTFKTKQMLALPEGDEQAELALTRFARLDGQNRLLGGKVAAFDMRAPPRIYLRVPGRGDELLRPGNTP
ncbi:MAG: FtsQ-type POTRA domain-containing protein [Pseudomonadota bacterium]